MNRRRRFSVVLLLFDGLLFDEGALMPQGTIKKLTDKGYGFIKSEQGDDLFFHLSSMAEDVSYDELQEGQAITYEEGQGPKGPRAEQVRPV